MDQTSRSPGSRALSAALTQAGISCDAERVGQIWAFHELLKVADAELNLTRLRSFGAMVEKHYVDSLLPLSLVALKGRVMDLGTGGGFPGMPIAIARPDLKLVLVEGRRKRTEFLEQAVMTLGLGNVEVVTRKLNPRDSIPVDHMIARAVAPSVDLLSRVASSVRVGGLAVLMKGPDCDHEIPEVAAAGLPFVLEQDIRYRLPVSQDPRRLLVWRRVEAEVPTAEATHGADDVFNIESEANARFRHWRQLVGGRGLRKHRESLLAGHRFVDELLRDNPGVIRGVLQRAHGRTCTTPSDVRRFELPATLFDQLDEAGTGGPIAWVSVPALAPWSGLPGRLSLLVATQLPDNVGALMRSAEALGASEVVVLEGAASPYHPRALRAGGAAAFRLPVVRGPAMDALPATLGTSAWALDAGGSEIASMALPSRLAVLVGREGQGVAEAPASWQRVAIAMDGRAESLNAAVAGAIALYAISAQRRAQR